MPQSATTLQQILVTCEALYQKDGFVRWVDVAKTHGVSRQAIQIRLRRAIENGDLDQATYDRWESMASRRTAAAKRASAVKKDVGLRTLRCVLTPENYEWLEATCTERGIVRGDVINGLLNKARMNK